MRKTYLIISILVTLIGCKKEETAIFIEKNQTQIEKLIAGNQRFLDEKSIHPHQNKKSIFRIDLN